MPRLGLIPSTRSGGRKGRWWIGRVDGSCIAWLINTYRDVETTMIPAHFRLPSWWCRSLMTSKCAQFFSTDAIPSGEEVWGNILEHRHGLVVYQSSSSGVRLIVSLSGFDNTLSALIAELRRRCDFSHTTLMLSAPRNLGTPIDLTK